MYPRATALRVIALVAAVMVTLTWAPVQARLAMDLRKEFDEYPTDESVVRLQIGMKAPDAGKVKVAMSLVVDVSLSMEGQSLKKIKDVASFLVRESAVHRDAFGMVTFGTEVREISPFKFLQPEDTDALVEDIQSIAAEGNTNLAEGVLAGLKQIGQLENNPADCRAKEVYVFTDGTPTEGITDPNEILEATERNRQEDVLITTLPFSDLSEFSLLQDIANVSGGESYPIAQLDDVVNAFTMAQARQKNRVAQGITFNLKLMNGAKMRTALTAGDVEENGDSIRITFPTLVAQEQRVSFFELAIPASEEGIQDLMRVELTYDDMTECKPVQEEARVLSVRRASAPKEAEGDQEVQEAQWRFIVAEAFEKSANSMTLKKPQEAADFFSEVTMKATSASIFQRSSVVQSYANGTQQLSDLLRQIETPSKYDTALVRELCDSMFKESTSLPIVDTETYGFLQLFDTPILKAARERGNAIINGEPLPSDVEEEQVPPETDAAEDSDGIDFPPFPPFPSSPPSSPSGEGRRLLSTTRRELNVGGGL